MITYRKAKLTDKEDIINLLTTSFLDYNFYKIYINNEEKRERFVRDIQELCINTSFLRKQVILLGIMDNIIISVAILISPETKKTTIFDYIFSGGIKLIFNYGTKTTFGFLGMLEEGNEACLKNYPNSWFLELLAVSNTSQGKGIGGKMLNDCVKPYIAHHGGGMITFITNSEENRSFYKKQGFIEFNKSELRRNDKLLGNWSYKKKIPEHFYTSL